jgi:hypothetical protein
MHGLFYPNLAVCQPEYSFWYYFLLGAIISLYPSNEHAMNNLFSSLFDLLSNSPGSLIYHLVLVFTIALSLQALLVNRRLTGDSAARRMVVGFLLGWHGRDWQILINSSLRLTGLLPLSAWCGSSGCGHLPAVFGWRMRWS